MTCTALQNVQASALADGAVASGLHFYARLPSRTWHQVRPILHRQRVGFIAVSETNSVCQVVGVHVWLSARPSDFAVRRLGDAEVRDSLTTLLRFRHEDEVEVSVRPSGRASV